MVFERPTLAQEMQLHLWPRTDVLGGLGQVASPLWGPVTQALTRWVSRQRLREGLTGVEARLSSWRF